MGTHNIDLKIKTTGAKQATAQLNSLNKAMGTTAKGVTAINSTTKAIHGNTRAIQSNVGSLNLMAKGFIAYQVAKEAVEGLTNVVVDSSKAFFQQERQFVKLNTIMKQAPGWVEGADKQIIKLTESLQKLGIVGDEVMQSGLAQLASFQIAPDSLNILAPGLANLTAWKYGTNANVDNTSALADMLGKVMSGQFGALTRAGIVFDDKQKALLQGYYKEKDQLGMATTLRKILDDNTGNINATLRASNEGTVKAFTNAMGDLKKEFGGGIWDSPEMKETLKQLTNTLSSPEFQAAIRGMGAATGQAILGIASWLGVAQSKPEADYLKYKVKYGNITNPDKEATDKLHNLEIEAERARKERMANHPIYAYMSGQGTAGAVGSYYAGTGIGIGAAYAGYKTIQSTTKSWHPFGLSSSENALSMSSPIYSLDEGKWALKLKVTENAIAKEEKHISKLVKKFAKLTKKFDKMPELTTEDILNATKAEKFNKIADEYADLKETIEIRKGKLASNRAKVRDYTLSDPLQGQTSYIKSRVKAGTMSESKAKLVIDRAKTRSALGWWSKALDIMSMWYMGADLAGNIKTLSDINTDSKRTIQYRVAAKDLLLQYNKKLYPSGEPGIKAAYSVNPWDTNANSARDINNVINSKGFLSDNAADVVGKLKNIAKYAKDPKLINDAIQLINDGRQFERYDNTEDYKAYLIDRPSELKKRKEKKKNKLDKELEDYKIKPSRLAELEKQKKLGEYLDKEKERLLLERDNIWAGVYTGADYLKHIDSYRFEVGQYKKDYAKFRKMDPTPYIQREDRQDLVNTMADKLHTPDKSLVEEVADAVGLANDNFNLLIETVRSLLNIESDSKDELMDLRSAVTQLENNPNR